MGIVHRDVEAILIAPIAPNPFTGGHLVNARLAEDPRVQLVPSRSLGEIDALAALEPSPADTGCPVIVDSLFLTRLEGLRRLRKLRNRTMVLLAHSLPSLLASGDRPARARLEQAERGALSLFDSVVVPSSFMARAVAMRGVALSQIRVVPLAPVVDGREDAAWRTPSPNRSPDARSAHGIPQLGTHILTIANWTPLKGVHSLWNALRTIGDLPWRWTVIGAWQDTTSGRALAERIRADPLGPRVAVRGPAGPERLGEAYAAADVFALPSAMESYGLVFAEALTFGLPILALDAGAVPEVVADAAELVPSQDVTALATAVRRLIANADMRAELARRARLRASFLPRWSDVRNSFLAAVSHPPIRTVPEDR